MVEINQFAKQFAKIGQNLNKAAFETRFNSVQRGLLQQRDREITKVTSDGTERKVAELQKKRDALFDKAERLVSIQAELKTNALRFLELRDTASTAIINADADDNQTLSEDEAAALNATVSALKEEIYKLNQTTQIPGITDGNLANRMRAELEILESFTAVAGPIDAEGSGSPTNDNRNFIDALNTIAVRSENYANSTTTLVGGINQVITDANKKAYSTEADLAQLTAGELAAKEIEINDIENRYSTLIKMISLAFEVNSTLADGLAQGTDFKAPRGSILNLFS
tara:strand:+ start:21793 stop:22644 length:852 start_codon:yes stop_codon:yes gene_type:complete